MTQLPTAVAPVLSQPLQSRNAVAPDGPPPLTFPFEKGRHETRKRERAWVQLFGCLCLSAGNGIALSTALAALYGIPNLRELGGAKTALIVAWFALCVPLAVFVYAAREKLLRSAALVPLAHVTLVLTGIAFATYLLKIVRG